MEKKNSNEVKINQRTKAHLKIDKERYDRNYERIFGKKNNEAKNDNTKTT